MKADGSGTRTIDEYIAGFPPDVQEKLEQIRMAIRKAAPDAEETISYQMPTLKLKGRNLVYFAAYKNHIGFYPMPSGMTEFQEELAQFAAGKGTARFPLDKPLPFDLIDRIVKFRIQENLRLAETKRGKKP